MLLVLRVVEWPEGVTPAPLAAHFDDDGGMIGRSETARLSLPDPTRTVSRFHAHVSCRDGIYYLEDMGSTNPTLVNGTVLTANQRYELALGDRVQVGGYTLAVEGGVAGSLDRQQLAPMAAASRRASVWSEEDAVHTRFVPNEEEEPALAPAHAAPAISTPTLPPVMPAAPSPYHGTTMPLPASEVLRELARAIPRDLATPTPLPPAPPPAQVPRRDAPATLPAMGAVSSAVPNSTAISSTASVSVDDLWLAFQEGAQAKIDLSGGLKPDLMRSIGAMLRSAIGGMRRLVGGATRSRSGNTLRLATDDARALAAALRPPVPGFLTGPAAVDEVISSLEAQQAAIHMAVRLVVDQVLQRLEPQALEGRLDGAGLLSGVSVLRKAKLWDQYAAQHRALVTEAREGLKETFERAVATAIELERKRRG